MTTWVHLMIGGTLGTISRYWISRAIQKSLGMHFPYGTLIVNLLGCFLVGFLAAVMEGKSSVGSYARILLIIGFCGAFTTFSTFMLETAHLIRDGHTFHAFLNVVASVMIGFLVFWAGVFLAQTINVPAA